MHKFINWSSLIRQMQVAGISQKEIGCSAGMSQPMVSRLASAKYEEPSHSEGEALRALFSQSFPGQPIPELPTPSTHPAPDSALEQQGV